MAPVCDPKWYFSLGLGTEFDTQATSFVDGTRFEPYSGDPSYQIDLKEHSYDEVFGNSFYRIQGELGYVLTPHIEVFGNFAYDGGYGRHVYGDQDKENFGTENYPLDNYFGLYRSWGGELGLRYYLFARDNDIRPFRTIRPYISLSGGASYVDHIGDYAYYSYAGKYYYPPAFRGTLYDGTVVGTGAFLIGIEVPVNCHWSLGLESGIRYQSGLDGTDYIRHSFSYYDTKGTGAPGTYAIGGDPRHYNDAGERLSVPVMGYIKFRF